MGIFVAILAPVSTQLIRTSDWDQNAGVRLVFGLSKNTEWKTNPKSEVAHWLVKLTSSPALPLVAEASRLARLPWVSLARCCYAHEYVCQTWLARSLFSDDYSETWNKSTHCVGWRFLMTQLKRFPNYDITVPMSQNHSSTNNILRTITAAFYYRQCILHRHIISRLVLATFDLQLSGSPYTNKN